MALGDALYISGMADKHHVPKRDGDRSSSGRVRPTLDDPSFVGKPRTRLGRQVARRSMIRAFDRCE